MVSTAVIRFRPRRSPSVLSAAVPDCSVFSAPFSALRRSASAPPARRPCTFLDLPLEIRNRIYEDVLIPDWLEPTEWGDVSKLGVPKENLGLLRVSRRVHEEATAVLYATLFLGGRATICTKYLDWLGPARVRQARKLVLSYECHQWCYYQQSSGQAVDWEPVFARLWNWWACPRQVLVYRVECSMRWHKYSDYAWPGNHAMEGKCRMLWDVEMDTFWDGLKSLNTVESIRFFDFCPRYFVDDIARDRGWRPSLIWDDPTDTVFYGSLLNPTFPAQFDWTLHVHGLIEEGVDVSMMTYDPEDTSWRYTDGPANDAEGAMVVAEKPKKPRITFFDLPPEVRRQIFDYACVHMEKEYWPVMPKRWHSGTEILTASKRVAIEVIPSMYRTIRLFGYDAIQPLARLGARARLVHAQRLELYFSCYCEYSFDRPAVRRTLYQRDVWDREHLNVLEMWRDAFAVLSAEPVRSTLREYDITMYSCQRCRRNYETTTHEHPEDCAELEALFVELLVGLRPQMERLTLSGDIPPSLAVRMAKESQGGPRMLLKWIDPAIRDFMTASLAAWRVEGSPVRGSPLARHRGEVWLNPVPHPDRCSNRDPQEAFILAAETTVAARWRERASGVCPTAAAAQTTRRSRFARMRGCTRDLVRVGRFDLDGLPHWSALRDAWDYANVSVHEQKMRDQKAENIRRAAEEAAAAAAEAAENEPPPPPQYASDSESEEDEEDRIWTLKWSLALAKAAHVIPWRDTPIWEED